MFEGISRCFGRERLRGYCERLAVIVRILSREPLINPHNSPPSTAFARLPKTSRFSTLPQAKIAPDATYRAGLNALNCAMRLIDRRVGIGLVWRRRIGDRDGSLKRARDYSSRLAAQSGSR